MKNENAIREMKELKSELQTAYMTEVYNKKYLINEEDIKTNEWRRAYLQGKIAGYRIAISILSV